MKKCPYCSAELLDDAEFCLYCMRQLGDRAAIQNKIKKPYWLIAVIGVLLALLACAVILFVIKFGTNGNEVHASSGLQATVIHASQNSDVSSGEAIGGNGLTGADDGSSEKETVDSSSDAQSSAPKTPSTDKDKSNGTKTDDTTTSNSSTDDDDKADDSSPSSSESGSTDNGSSGAQSGESSSQQPSSAPDSSDDDQEQPAATWSIKTVDGGVEITGIANKNTSGNYEIPSQIDGKTVVGIGYQAFYYEQSLKSITLPNTIKYIGEQAFANCSALTEIVIPASVKSIGTNAFLPCDKLADIYIASTDISIAANAFSNSYQRSVSLTLHAPSSVMNSLKARTWDAEYEEWNG